MTISDGGGDDGSASDASAGDGSATDAPSDGNISSCKAPSIDLSFRGCPAAPACGGSIADGTYFYTAGCIPDPWAQAMQQCKALKISNEKGSVKGCVTIAGGVVTRDVSATYGATLDVPVSCTFNTPCSQIEAGLKMFFNTATCMAGSAVGSCTCNVASQTMSVATTTFMTQNNQIVTSTNNHYDYCVQGKQLSMRWASGPNAEPGVYDLTKQ